MTFPVSIFEMRRIAKMHTWERRVAQKHVKPKQVSYLMCIPANSEASAFW